MKTKTNAPVQLGEPIPNTHLIRRWQNKKEVHPTFVHERDRYMTTGQCCAIAFMEAAAAGYKAVQVRGQTYAYIGDEWFVWSIP